MNKVRTRPSPWGWYFLSLVPGTLFLALFVWRSRAPLGGPTRFTLFDDAMVSLAYGRTLALTGEWVWFPGADRVQGFTNPLWTAYMALLHGVGLDGSSAALAVSLTGIALVLGTASMVFLIVHAVSPGSTILRVATSAVAAGTVPFVYPFVFWSLRGMEVGLLGFLSLALVGVALHVRVAWQATTPYLHLGVLFATVAILGVLTRLDFLLPILVVAAITALGASSLGTSLRFLSLALIPVLFAVIGVLVFQQFYFGDMLPNTYSLKMGGFDLFERLQRGFLTTGVLLPLSVIVLLALIVCRLLPHHIRYHGVPLMLAGVWFTTVGYSIYVGGDAWEWSSMGNRFVATAMPAATALAFIALAVLMTRPSINVRYAVGALIVVVASGLGYAVGVNPVTVSWDRGLTVLALLLVTTLLLILSLLLYYRNSNSSASMCVALLSLSLVLLSSTSTFGVATWLRIGGLHVQDDVRETNHALEVRDATQPDAVIGTVWAGAPGYYLDRRVVDLLGKNDAVVAKGPPGVAPEGSPFSTFYPGHNKWNFSHSVGKLRPDVILRLWNQTPEELHQLKGWGYLIRCLSDGTNVLVNSTSPRVRVDAFTACPGSPKVPQW